MDVAHIPFHLGPGNQGRHAVDYNAIDGAAPYQLFRYIQSLFGAVRLGDQQIVQIQPAITRVMRVHGVLHIDIGGQTTRLLGLRHNVNSQGGLACRFGAIDFSNAPPGNSTHAQRQVQGQGAGGNDLSGNTLAQFSQAHHRALSVVLFDFAQGYF